METDTVTTQDSPGGDVLQRHPTLPESVFDWVVHNAVSREQTLRAHYNNPDPRFTKEELSKWESSSS